MALAPLSIPGLTKLPQQTWRQDFKFILDEFVSLTPIQGWITVQHQGSYLRVATEAKTIINLTCDRCLQQYNQRILCQVEELIWLELDDLDAGIETGSQELDLLERLPAQGEFDPQDWLYQQLCLSLPHPQICQVDCRGLDVELSPTHGQSDSTELSERVDHRWASLAALKQQLEP
ncbi:YceD family protein [Thermosynechococcaceae cyanobacterium BACA0444]|uniref:YceD family protein n=1 Tax=Pseudocalidococcus azoricus BACA0444 TaxID=2918990 RepID=A0AAE4FQR2_9CYAN|nr:YceD family protein [Pseudocalidococcus azoricus]MDS3860539.1 YceD family protein [Pseudocalidococcus azoricus BACA0444]